MQKTRFLITLGLAWLLSLSLSAQGLRYTASLNDSWLFYKGENEQATTPTLSDSKAWTSISLPHTWNAADAFDDERGYYMGTGWYRKKLEIPSFLAGKQIFLHFEGANQVAEVFLDGQKVGEHYGGYTAFSFDITNLVKPGNSHVLAVKVNNAIREDMAPLSADFTFYGGIYRDVWLKATEKQHLSLTERAAPGVVITYPAVSEAEGVLQAQARLRNDGAQAATLVVTSTLLNAEGKAVNSVKQSLKLKAGEGKVLTLPKLVVKSPALWSPDKPSLYTLHTTVATDKGQLLDEEKQPVAFRWYRFEPGKGFFLNGKALKLIGTNRHQDRAGRGNALSNEMHRQDIRLLKEMGANFLRIAHYPQDEDLLRACDELGILVWEEIPVVNEISPIPAFFQRQQSQLLDMIAQHRNHPSVIIWGYMNEVFLRKPKDDAQTKATVALARFLDSTARATDPARYTAQALHNGTLYNESGIADIPQVVGWNLYHGWYHNNFPDFGKKLDEEFAKYPKRNLIIAEFGAGSDRRIHSLKPERYDFSTEYAEDYHRSYLQQILDRPYVAGGTMWNLVDFGSEGRKETMQRINNKGLLTMDRTPKDVYYLYRTLLSSKPTVYIATRDWPVRQVVSSTGPKYFRHPVRVFAKNVVAFSFFLNDRFVKKVFVGDTARQNVYTIDPPFSPGENRIVVVGEDANAGAICQDIFVLRYEFQLAKLSDAALPFRELAVNCGTQAIFVDPETNLHWQADRPYSEGGFGYIGGRELRASNGRISTTDDILGTTHDPLYQNLRDSLQAYRFDVPDGHYRLRLLFTETDPNTRTILNDIGASGEASKPKAERIFSVLANGQTLLENLNLAKDYGFNQAVDKTFELEIKGGKGLQLDFKALSGEARVCGIHLLRIR